jgi:hypothetical protein
MEAVTYIMLGASGSGKSSFINLVLGSDVAPTSSDEDCTKDVTSYTRMTVAGNLRVIDTPGFGSGDLEAEKKRMVAISDGASAFRSPRLIFVSRCDENRLRPVEKQGLKTFVEVATGALPNGSWLALTFCASVDSQRLNSAAHARERQLHSYIKTLSSDFRGFEKTLLVDSMVRGWGRNGKHVLSSFCDGACSAT